MKTLHLFAILITAAWLTPAQAETPPHGDLAIGSKISSLHLENGRTYENVTVTKIDDEGVSIRHESGLTRIKFDQFPAEFHGATKDLVKSVEPPPPRFPTDALLFFAAVSSQHWFNGDPVKGIADPEPALTRLAATSDLVLKEAVAIALALDSNQKTQAAQGRFIEAKMNGLVPNVQGEILAQGAKAAATAQFGIVGYDSNGQTIYQEKPQSYEGFAGGIEQSMDGANTQAALNRMSELNIQSLVLGRSLREKLTALALRDLPKADLIPSPIVVAFVKPGVLCITNRSGKTLHHCLFSTATTMLTPKDESKDQAIANVLNRLVGLSAEFSRESAKQTALRAELAGAERGYVVYTAVLRDHETVTIPFCDMPSLPAAGSVRLSLWTDEFTGENAPVGGLQALKEQLQMEAKARWEREHANAEPTKNAPLNNGNRVNLQPKIPRDPNNPLHQGNGARIFNR